MERKNRCCIATCKGERFDLAHKFPRSQEVADSWLQAIDNPNLRTIHLRKLNESYQNLNQLHLARDSTPREVENSPLNLKNFNQMEIGCELIARETQALPLNLENSNHADVPNDSIQNETETLLEIENDQLNITFEENKPTNEAIDEEKHNSADNIEYVEVTSDEMDLDSINTQLDPDGEKNTFKVIDYTTSLEILHSNYEKPFNLDAFWLRCHCQCSECFDSETKRKKFSPLDIPIYIQTKEIIEGVTEDSFLVEWEDGHCSTYNIEFLLQIDVTKKRCFLKKLPFNSNTFQKPPQIDFINLVSFDDRIAKTFKNLILHGFICVTGISIQNTSMAKLIIERLFPNQQAINFQPFDEIHSDICTNLTCANFDCGLKFFFVTQKSKIILVDGQNIIEELKQFDMHAFQLLTSTSVPINIRDNNVYHEKSTPIIEIENEIEGNLKIQLDMQTFGMLNILPQDKIANFYHSLEQLMTIIRKNKNQIILTLEPGTMIILDNWRVLHKMCSNLGIQQCYLSRNDYIGRSRYLELL
ncbi:trimethyllysine dioxygenase, mitochondrial-like [Episyrphus balteatus]|uniref:trimethyllysine dioxygenase, mitochondrial-like n=1 Tax=Episyrphus balteatus TaxID=286459 RepID=UPI0024862EEA|nr:trimethyllysine dioxygenase, mitochondrial-like [Episyrphus balteatus]